MILQFSSYSTEKVKLIGFSHIILAIFSAYATVNELIAEEAPVANDLVAYLIAHFVFHVLIALLLVWAVKKQSWLYAAPWMVTIFIIFSIITFYNFKYSTLTNLYMYLSNLAVVLFLWYCWWTVMFHFVSVGPPIRMPPYF